MPDPPTFVVPPLRDLFRHLGPATLAATLALAALGWQAALIVGASALVLRAVAAGGARATFSFGDGFLPYRARNAWPRGVQEDDEVRWQWSSRGSESQAVDHR